MTDNLRRPAALLHWQLQRLCFINTRQWTTPFSAGDTRLLPLMQHHFSQTIADYIQYKVDPSGCFGIADTITWGMPMEVSTSSNLNLPPRSMDDFLFSMTQILSSDASELIRSQAQAFDRSVGIHGLADKFIGLRPAREAMLDVIDGAATRAEAVADQAVPFRPEQANPSTPASEQQHTDHHGDRESHPPAEEPPTMAPGSATGQPSTNTQPRPIIELQLEGSTILEAWNGNPTIRAMEQLANSHERNADPAQFLF
ncbi:hypothetical protein B0T25DRAFT_53945 [Lasiosphaeria hispida]|uniref:Uncharacterized protein n=1 Tax=Lasiosphaeria hispida TaxID=260671 RepID=A0AAJ0MKG8_9PEZI|nr:hypothetical protein B0T25DRAFT_53945 [Lasiosphaeria hispida]